VSLEGLEPEQRAVLELLLARERSYSFVAGALDLDEDDVAQTAHDALRVLTPVTSARVGALDREAIGNLLLGQASPAQTAEAQAALKRPSAAREWAASLLDQLGSVAKPGTLPDLPPIQRAPAAARPSRVVIGGAAAALVVVAVAAYLIGNAGGDSGKPSNTSTATTAAQAPKAKVERQGKFVAAKGEKATGAAIVYDQGGAKTLAIQADLPLNDKTNAYEVWLYNSDADLQAVGVRVTDSTGLLQGAAQIDKGYTKYGSVVLSREKTNTSPTKPTTIVARAPLAAPSGGG
jgi:hypothetical protein